MPRTTSVGIPPTTAAVPLPVHTCAPQSTASSSTESVDKADLTKTKKDEKPGWWERARQRLDEFFPPNTTAANTSQEGYMERFLNKVLGKTEKDGKTVPRYLGWKEKISKFFNGDAPSKLKPRL